MLFACISLHFSLNFRFPLCPFCVCIIYFWYKCFLFLISNISTFYTISQSFVIEFSHFHLALKTHFSLSKITFGTYILFCSETPSFHVIIFLVPHFQLFQKGLFFQVLAILIHIFFFQLINRVTLFTLLIMVISQLFAVFKYHRCIEFYIFYILFTIFLYILPLPTYVFNLNNYQTFITFLYVF